jgi:DNA-binding NtrC family response regulator
MPWTGSNRQPRNDTDSLSKRKLLLVDGDCTDLERCRTLLLQRGYEVQSLGSYKEAEDYLEFTAYDLVVVCQGSPAFEGRKVLERVVEANRRTPVLVVTRNLDMGCYLEAMQLGAVDYVEKPVAATDMLRVLESHLPPLRSKPGGHAA